VYVHFDDVEDLFLAAAEHQVARVAGLVKPVPMEGPTEYRVRAMCDVRASVFEEGGGVRRAADLQSPYSPKLAAFLDRLDRASRASISDVFAPELDALDAATREERVAALDVVLSARAWQHLRKGCGFSFDRARRVFVDSALALLTGIAGPDSVRP
jgi:AcrR family transcriptional regulator